MKTTAIYRTSYGVTESSTEFPPHDGERLATAEGKLTLANQERDRLRELLPPGTEVFCVLRQVSSSGMSRRISFLTFRNGSPYYLDYSISKVLDITRPDKGEGLLVKGGGMDMGFHVVNSLSYALHGMGRDTDKPEQTAARGDARPGYTLNHRWI